MPASHLLCPFVLLALPMLVSAAAPPVYGGANPAEPDDVTYINQRGFQIPLTPWRYRHPQAREVLLYVSRDRGETWEIYARTTPDRKGFDFFTDNDGLLYFSIVVIDAKNLAHPPDVYRSPVKAKVLVDTVKPVAKLVLAERVGLEIQVGWEAGDEHPEWASLKLEYRPNDLPTRWRQLPVNPGPRGRYRFKPGVPGPVTVRLTLRDLAGNESSDEKLVPGCDSLTAQLWAEAPPLHFAPPSPPNLYLVKKKQVKIDFQVPHTPPSAVGTVDVYMTTDDGKTWARHPTDPKVRLPITANSGDQCPIFAGSVTVPLPEEGKVYGFYLVARNRAGVSNAPPRPRTAPQVLVERDTQKPEVELYPPQPAPDEPGAVQLNWKASDRNLASDPIMLLWAPGPEGPWQWIDNSSLPNTGHYIWHLPKDIPPKVYLCLRVLDRACNVAVAETPRPVPIVFPQVPVITAIDGVD